VLDDGGDVVFECGVCGDEVGVDVVDVDAWLGGVSLVEGEHDGSTADEGFVEGAVEHVVWEEFVEGG
jgi:hypothetical protein